MHELHPLPQRENAAPSFNLRSLDMPGLCSLLPVLLRLRLMREAFDSSFGDLKKPEREGQLITIGRVMDVPVGRSATIELPEGMELALYNVEGQFYAIENFCPHKGAPLAGGRVCGQA